MLCIGDRLVGTQGEHMVLLDACGNLLGSAEELFPSREIQ